MVEENFQFKGSETHQNEGFWVKTHLIIHHGWRKFSIQKRSGMHQNQGFGKKLIQYFTVVEQKVNKKLSLKVAKKYEIFYGCIFR